MVHEPDQAPGDQASDASGRYSKQNAVECGREPSVPNGFCQIAAEQGRNQADAGNREQPEFTGGFVLFNTFFIGAAAQVQYRENADQGLEKDLNDRQGVTGSKTSGKTVGE